jgi:tRNA-splicing ligase RtcB
MSDIKMRKVNDYLWEIPKEGKMRVPARIYATDKMIDAIRSDNAPEQTANVAHLPGIVKYSLAMPDIHWGYGFPIGGVAAFDMNTGVISPGGVGYDINCGVRLMASKLSRQDIQPKIKELVTSLFHHVPTGVGSKGELRVTPEVERKVVKEGAVWAVKNGYGTEEDLEYIEENGRIEGANPSVVSKKALERGRAQLGTLGSGNHFLEVGYVAEIYDEEAAKVLGLELDQVTVFIHCGSRGFGHQICDDYIAMMNKAVQKYGIDLPDRQLCCAPINSPEGQEYLQAMRCAVNYAFANRQVIAAWTREAFEKALKMSPKDIGLRIVYEVAHNIAKMETHNVDGKEMQLCVHRKGATRAFAPGSTEIPEAYKSIGQPVLIPGDMGRYSYVLVGSEGAMQDTFGSTCHGAGRAMSRNKAKRTAKGRAIVRELEDKGIYVKASSRRTIDEEISEAYKDVANVVDACQLAGISKKVAQLRPIGCIKG